MSSSNKTVSSGGRGTVKNKSSQHHGKSDHHSKSDTGKHDKSQKSDQRHTQIMDNRTGSSEDAVMKERIKQVMEMTRRSEDEVIMALHDAEGDFDRAVNDLLEGVTTEWEVKKKKPRQPNSAKQNTEVASGQEESADWEERRNHQRSSGSGPPRMRGRQNHDNRGWRGRENKENDRNSEDNVRDSAASGNRRGRGGPVRAGRGGRGGGRVLGPRTFANRGESSTPSSHSFNRPIDTWAGSKEQQQSIQEPKMDAWKNLEPSEDWDNEEYTGSLADTKVFTPSTILEGSSAAEEPKIQELPTIQAINMKKDELQKSGDVPIMQQQQQQPMLNLPTMHMSQQPNAATGGTLTAAQSQYLSQFTQPSGDNLKGTGQQTFSATLSSQPPRQARQAKPRVPPPSKIPQSAVEMPGDAVNSIGFLDVQFGALEFGSDSSSLDGSATEKYNSSNVVGSAMDMASSVNASNTSGNSLDIESSQTSSNQYSSASQMQLSSSENLPASSDHTLTSQQSGYPTRSSATGQSLDITKQDFTSQVSPGNVSAYGSATSYQSQKTSYQGSSAAPNSYNAYSSNSQTAQSSFPSVTGNNYSTTTTVAQPSYNTSSTYPQSNASTYSQSSPSVAASASTGYNQSVANNQTYQQSGYAATTTSQYQAPSVATNTASNTNSGYQTSGYPAGSAFQSTPQTYQPSATTFSSPITQGSGGYQSASQSVYASAYSSYSSQQQTGSHNHKLNSSTNKDSQYDSSTTTSSSSLATTSAPLGLSSTSVNSSQTKVSSSNVPKSSTSGMASGSSGSTGSMASGNAAGNMTQMLGPQYIMGQTVPYFQQPMYASFEDLQLMQQRMPHMPTTGYYDAAMGYQTAGPATSLGGGRGDALPGVQGVQGVQGAYTSINEPRFARNDSNASPVPSTISQQTATGHQGPMINPTFPGYAYICSSIMPGGFQYGAPIYSQQIATAGNAGTTSGPYNTKPGSYGSGYGGGAGYDILASGGPANDFKGSGSGYSGSQSGKTGTSTGNTSSTGSSVADISSSMYQKSHVALSKVNSYDKQAFHSGTPPPFNLSGSQNVGMPNYAQHLFIPTLNPHMQPQLHHDGSSGTGQRSNANSQNKTQSKSNYNSSYWTGSN